MKSLGILLAVVVIQINAVAADTPATQPGQTVDLLVIDGSTHQPLSGASVAINNTAGDDTKLTVGSDGHLLVPVPPANGFSYFAATIKAPGYGGKLLEWRPKDKDPIPAQYTISLDRGAKIGGRIADESGQPVVGAHIVIWLGPQKNPAPHERNFIDSDAQDIVSSSDGTWSFADAPADLQSVEMGCWDYRFANGDSFEMKNLTAQQLHDATETYVLRKGVAVTGVVQDASGKPLAGAEVLTGAQLCSNRVPSQKTGPDGTFNYVAKSGDEVTLTVTCEGYAPELKQFMMGADAHDIAIKLSRSKPMIGRVVGPKGQPVPFAWVYADTWRGARSLEIRIRADKDGKFQWKDAPLDTVYCDVDGSENGFIRRQNVPLTAADQEISVTLHSALLVTGTVVDAQTNKPIDSFNIIHGIFFGQNQPINWERNPQSTTTGKDGKFEFHSTWSYPGYAVRIEASGYQPAESRVFTEDEGTVALEFKLTKGDDVTATVLKPDGKPASGATVVLALGGQSAYIRNGRDVMEQGCQKSTSAADGKFTFPPQTGAFKLVVISDDGYAETDNDALTKDSSIKLQAWGRISGTLKIAHKPGAGEQVVIVPSTGGGRIDVQQPRVYHQIETKADADGKFTFDRVPPGEGVTVAREIMRPMGGGSFMGSYTLQQKVDVAPGQSVEVALGGNGRLITGQVDVPPELAADQNWAFGAMCSAVTRNDLPPFPAMPDEIKNGTDDQKKQWRVDYLKTDAGKVYLAAQKKLQDQVHMYPMQIEQDGKFHIDDVAAGSYTLSVDIARKVGDSTCGPGESIALGSSEFTVPEMQNGQSDEALKIPDVSMKMLKFVSVGTLAPDFSEKTLGGTDLKLSDLRGKYVLLDFWATWCGPCIAELPSIKAAYETYSTDPRFVMISVSLDEKAQDAKTYADRNGMAWNQVFQTGEWQAPIVQAYGVRSIPALYLIGPDGKVTAKDLRGDAIKTAVGAALGNK